MSDPVEDFLAHHGIPGMKWGKHKAKSQTSSTSRISKSNTVGSSNSTTQKVESAKPKMSRNKKIAIGIGIGAVVAIGAAVALSSMNKSMDLPISSLTTNKSTDMGKHAVSTLTTSHSPFPQYPTKSSKSTSLDLGPTGGSATKVAPRTSGLDLGPRTSTSSAAPKGAYRQAGPSLDTLSNLINGGPQVSYNAKTGKYETK